MRRFRRHKPHRNRLDIRFFKVETILVLFEIPDILFLLQ
jgi:hypothetical protein